MKVIPEQSQSETVFNNLEFGDACYLPGAGRYGMRVHFQSHPPERGFGWFVCFVSGEVEPINLDSVARPLRRAVVKTD